MTADETRELFGYNAWASRLLFDAAAALSDEVYQRDLKSSFGGIHGTLAHIVWAEQLWLCRWLGRPHPAVPQGRDLTSLAAVRARWKEIEAERRAVLRGVPHAQPPEGGAVPAAPGGEVRHRLRGEGPQVGGHLRLSRRERGESP